MQPRPLQKRLRALFFAFGAVLAAGCAVGELELETGPATQNSCQDDDECGEGRCVSGQCRAESGKIQTLLLEVTPPADAVGIGGVRFVRDVTNLDPRGGVLSDGDGLVLDHTARIEGTVQGQSGTEPSRCVPPTSNMTGVVAVDGSFPARVMLTPRERLLGVQSPPHATETQPASDGRNRFVLNVSKGSYDVYVEPLAPVGACAMPPQLFLGASIEAGGVELKLVLPPPQHLEVSVRIGGPEPGLEGWTLDVVEQDSGRVLSTVAQLREPEKVGDELWYQALVAYSPVQAVDPTAGNAKSGTELVRLSPPKGVTASVIVVQRSVVELFQQGQGVIDQLDTLPVPVEVTGQVTEAGTPEGKAATVTLVATKLRGVAAGTVASFQRTVEADSTGRFDVSLLPGTYSVFAVPASETGLAAAVTEWEINASDVQAGKLVQLNPSSVLSARMTDAGGRAIAGVPVQAAATPAATFADVLDRALGKTTFVPRAEGTVSSLDGEFEVRTDPGLFDLWVRPEVRSGFAWFVRSSVSVGGAGVDLGKIALPLPVEYRGTLLSMDTSGAVPSALVRAYAYLEGSELTNDPTKATSLIQVAETRTNQEGDFRLLLPASF